MCQVSVRADRFSDTVRVPASYTEYDSVVRGGGRMKSEPGVPRCEDKLQRRDYIKDVDVRKV